MKTLYLPFFGFVSTIYVELLYERRLQLQNVPYFYDNVCMDTLSVHCFSLSMVQPAEEWYC